MWFFESRWLKRLLCTQIIPIMKKNFLVETNYVHLIIFSKKALFSKPVFLKFNSKFFLSYDREVCPKATRSETGWYVPFLIFLSMQFKLKHFLPTPLIITDLSNVYLPTPYCVFLNPKTILKKDLLLKFTNLLLVAFNFKSISLWYHLLNHQSSHNQVEKFIRCFSFLLFFFIPGMNRKDLCSARIYFVSAGYSISKNIRFNLNNPFSRSFILIF